MITFVVVADEGDNTDRGERPEDRVVIEFNVWSSRETTITCFFPLSLHEVLNP